MGVKIKLCVQACGEGGGGGGWETGVVGERLDGPTRPSAWVSP